MLYDKYESKMKKLAKMKNTVLKYKLYILFVFALSLLLSIGYLSTKGSLTKDLICPSEFIYGAPIQYEEANALFSDIKYEFSAVNSNLWTNEMPIKPGNYLIRAVSKKSFGNKGYSDPQQFVIKPKAAEISFKAEAIQYGNRPELVSNLSFEDYIDYDKLKFIYGDAHSENSVQVDISTLRILNRDYQDVTDYYILPEIINSKITNIERKIEVTPVAKNKIYDGKMISYSESDFEFISSQSFAFEDRGSALFKFFDKNNAEIQTLINAGEYFVQIDQLNIMNGDQDVSHNYLTEMQQKSLKIEKRPIIVKTESLSKHYDGLSMSAGWEILLNDQSLGLIDNHHIEIIHQAQLLNARKISNEIAVKIVDELGNDVSENYDIEYEYGTLEILPQSLNVSLLAISDKVYDQISYQYSEKDFALEGTLIDDDHFVLSLGYFDHLNQWMTTNPRDAGAYNVKIIDVEFKRGLRTNYQIQYGVSVQDFQIKERKIRVETSSEFKIYDGLPLYGTYLLQEEQSGEGLLKDHQLSVIKNPELIDTGIRSNEILFQILELNQKDVTANYEIVYEKIGVLEITQRQITISLLEIQQKDYDGNLYAYPSGIHNYELMQGNLIGSDALEISVKYYRGILEVNPPMDAGLYQIKIADCQFLTGRSDNYSILYDIEEREMTISPREIFLAPIQMENKVYDGKAMMYSSDQFLLPGNSFIGTDTVEIATRFYTLQGEERDALNAGTYSVKIIGHHFIRGNSENYRIQYAESEVQVEILRREIQLSILPILNKTYDGEGISYSDESGNYLLDPYFNFIGADNLKLIVELSNSHDLTDIPLNAGHYYGVILGHQFTEGLEENYTITYRVQRTDFEITPREIILTPVQLESKDYDGIEVIYPPLQYNVQTLDFIGSDRVQVSVRFRDSNGIERKPIDAGIYWLEITAHQFIIGESQNYAISYSINPVQLEIYRREVKLSIEMIPNKVYDGVQVAYRDEVGNYILEPNFNFIGSDDLKLIVEFRDLNDEVISPINAGKYAAVIRNHQFVRGNENNYRIVYAISRTEFEITPREIVLSLLEMSDKIYDGNAHLYPSGVQNYLLVSGSLIAEDQFEVIVSYYDEKLSEILPLNVGKYRVKIMECRFERGLMMNYLLQYDVSERDFNIRPRTILISLFEIQNKEYDGIAFQYAMGSGNYLTHQGSLIGEDQFEVIVKYLNRKGEETSPIDAGFYLIRASDIHFRKGFASNYFIEFNILERELSILPKRITLEPISLENKIYDGIEVIYPSDQYTLLNSSFINGDKIDLTVLFRDSDGMIQRALNAGFYTLEIIGHEFIQGNAENYEILYSEAVLSFEILRREIKISILPIQDKDYDGESVTYEAASGNYALEPNCSWIDQDNLKIIVGFRDNFDQDVLPVNAGSYYGIILGHQFTQGLERNYLITYVNIRADFKINPRYILITSFQLPDKIYDRREVIYPAHVQNFIIKTGSFIGSDSLTLMPKFINQESEEVNPIDAGKYNVSTKRMLFSEGTIGANYYISYLATTFRILPRDLHLTPLVLPDKIYDREKILYPDGEGNFLTEDLIAPDQLKIRIEFTDHLGKVVNPIHAGSYSIVITGYDFTEGLSANYTLLYHTSEFIIYKRSLNISIITPELCEKVYDGMSYFYRLTPENYLSDNLVAGDTFLPIIEYRRKLDDQIITDVLNAGFYRVELLGLMGDSRDNYEINRELFSFDYQILPRKITVQTVHQEKTFDDQIFLYPENQLNLIGNFIGNDSIILWVRYEKSGSIVQEPRNAGVYAIIPDTVEFTHGLASNYQITLDNQNPAELVIHPAKIYIKAVNDSKIYDSANYLYEKGYQVSSDFEDSSNLIGSHTLIIQTEFKDQNGNISLNPNNAGVYQILIVAHQVLGTLPENYQVIYLNDAYPSYLIILKREVSIAPLEVRDKIYDGLQTELNLNDIRVISEQSFIGDDQRLVSAILSVYVDNRRVSEWTDAGAYEIRIDSISDMLDQNYLILFDQNVVKFTVQKFQLNISLLQPDHKIYDGLQYDPFQNGTFICDDVLPNGENLSVLILLYLKKNNHLILQDNNPVNAGIYQITFDSYAISGGRANAENYTVNIPADCLFEIYRREIIVSTGSITAIYNGTAISCADQFQLDAESRFTLVTNHKLSLNQAYEIPSLVRVGNKVNSLKIMIREDQIDQTDNYAIFYKNGTIQVVKRSIEITTDSKTGIYQGQQNPFKWGSMESFETEAQKSGLISGQTIQIDLSSLTSIVDCVETSNRFAVFIKNGEEDVSDCYDIHYRYGLLKLERAVLKLDLMDDEFIYNKKIYQMKYVFKDQSKLMSGDVLSADYLITMNTGNSVSSIMNSGHYEVALSSFKILYESKDVTGNYDVQFGKNRAEIQINPVHLKIITGNKTFVFTNQAQSFKNFECQGTVLTGDFLQVTDFTTIQYPGSKSNLLKVEVVEEAGFDNYVLDYAYGVLTIPNIVKVSNLPSVIYSGGAITQRNYEIMTLDDHGQIIQGLVCRVGIDGVFRNTDHNQIEQPVYVGIYQTHIVRIELAYIGEIGMTESERNLYFQSLEVYLNEQRIKDAGGQDYLSDLEIEISILPQDIKIKPSDKNKIYDGLAFYTEESDYVIMSGQIIRGDVLKVASTYSIKNPLMDAIRINDNLIIGASVFDSNGIDRTYCYQINFGDGTLDRNNREFFGKIEIQKRILSVKTGSASKVYDGTELYCNDYEILSPVIENTGLIQNHQFKLEENGFGIVEGSRPNRVAFFIYNANLDVTDNYRVNWDQAGILEITKRKIVIRTGSADKFYDGTALTSNQYTVENLPQNFTFELILEFTGKQTLVGNSLNTVNEYNIVIYIPEEDSSRIKNLWKNFEIEFIYGTLEVFENYA